ncbi:MAG: MBL fold metallo-hydrolase [Pseudomonadota bacterium]|nr:MBL fold metallo-hydrolase [Pseudomonadota bacterium]
MEIVFHGVRGSTPTPLKQFLKYGGNTTCTEIRSDNFQFIFDAGTGFQNLQILNDRPVYLFFSHFHYDHIQGLPFNGAIFDPSNAVTICTGLGSAEEIKNVFTRAFQPMYFPIPLVETLKNLRFHEFKDVQSRLKREADISIESITLNHPGGASGYSVKSLGKKICLFLDHEYGVASDIDKNLHLAANAADIVVWDGMFLDEELESKRGWGHSSIEQGIKFAEDTDCKKFAIAHHAPSRTDEQLKELENNLPSDNMFVAAEKMKIVL